MSGLIDTGAAMTSVVKPSSPSQQETLTDSQSGVVDTGTIVDGQPGQTVVTTVSGIIKTVTMGSRMSGKCLVGPGRLSN